MESLKQLQHSIYKENEELKVKYALAVISAIILSFVVVGSIVNAIV